MTWRGDNHKTANLGKLAQPLGKGCVSPDQRLCAQMCILVAQVVSRSHLMTPSKDTVLCMSLAGRPGTFGVRFHNHLYQQLGLDYYYKAMTTTDLAAAVGGIRALGVRGCGVSMPFKEACIPMLDELDPSAAAIDSVRRATALLEAA